MNKKRRSAPRQFDDQFRLTVLKDFYESGASYGQIARKYHLSSGNIFSWERRYASKVLSLPPDIEELERQVYMARKSRDIRRAQSASMTAEDELRSENARLRKALEYSELRNEALHTLLRIGKDEYGIDLLKKAGAKQ